MLSKKEEFYAKRRMNRHIFKSCEPELEFQNIKMEQEYCGKHPEVFHKKEIVKSAIENLYIQLKIKKIKVDIQRNNRVMMFHSKRRWVVLTWCWSGYITIKSNLETPHDISFMISDYRDILDKMEKFEIIWRKDFY